MIVLRYERLPSPDSERQLLAKAGAFQGLMGLVVEILRLEASLSENTPDGMASILTAIGTELERSGLPPRVLFGEHGGPRDYIHQAFAPLGR